MTHTFQLHMNEWKQTKHISINFESILMHGVLEGFNFARK